MLYLIIFLSSFTAAVTARIILVCRMSPNVALELLRDRPIRYFLYQIKLIIAMMLGVGALIGIIFTMITLFY